jgi:hypothetical protein
MKLNPPRRLRPVLLACALALTGAAHAADEASMFSLSGFATLGLAKTGTDDARFTVGGQTRGATTDVSGEVDSKLGLQVGAKFNPMFSATAQVLTKQNGEGKYTPALEWGFVKAQLSPALGLRVGRMGAPFFAVSDFRDVGFANTWLRPPTDVYSQVPLSHFDGADISYQLATGVGTINAQIFGGQSKDTYRNTDFRYKKMVGFNATLELDGGLTLRVGHVTGKLTFDNTALAGLVSVLRSTPFASVGNQLDITNKTASFTGFGAAWDTGDWVLSSEYTQRRTESAVPDTDGWYVTVGRRVGAWTPYVTASELKYVSGNAVNTVQPLNATLIQLKAAVDGTLATQKQAQKSLAAGARWDFYRNFALKGQIDRIKPDGNGLFTAVRAGSGFGTGNTVTVYSLSVDTVF